jgi:hypothetical protein
VEGGSGLGQAPVESMEATSSLSQPQFSVTSHSHTPGRPLWNLAHAGTTRALIRPTGPWYGVL